MISILLTLVSSLASFAFAKQACFIPGPNSCKPITVPLVDIFKRYNAPYGNMTYQWDLNKNLYATIRLDTKKHPDAKLKTSSFYIWSDATLLGYPNYVMSMNSKNSITCATFTIPMNSVCNPVNCRAADILLNPTCAPYKSSQPCKNADLRYYMVVYTQPIAIIKIMNKEVTIGVDGVVPLDNTVSCHI